jgi:quercetin dioxygenase-like cupin family protein
MSRDEELHVDRLARHSLRFRRRVVELAPDGELDMDAHRWRDALVLLESGQVELECAAGECCRFAAGSVLCLPPSVRFLRNSGNEPARLIAISRRTRERSNRSG